MFKRIINGLIVVVMIVILTGCGKDQRKVVVASKPMTEQYIIAEMITAIIENETDIKVEQKLGIGGGTANIQPAMEKGEIDIYPEYTGTGWLFVLKEELINDGDKLYEEVKKEYKDKYNIRWMGKYGFNNTFALAIKEDRAQELGIETYSQLAQKGEGLIFGAEYDFYEREDGLQGLEKIYGLKFKDKVEMDIGLKYDAIGGDKVHVINAFSTDSLLRKHNLRVLEDDKNFFPSYEAATLVREETLEKYPELEELLKKLEGIITNEKIIDMNYKVENEKMDPKEVALEFLREEGVID